MALIIIGINCYLLLFNCYLLPKFRVFNRIDLIHNRIYLFKYILYIGFREIIPIGGIGRSVRFGSKCLWLAIQIAISILFFHNLLHQISRSPSFHIFIYDE